MSATSKADRLRNRLTINPDELSAPPRPAPAAVPDQLAEAAAPPTVVPTEPEAGEESELAQQPRNTGEASTRRDPPSGTATAPVNALQDPNITPGRKDYRSFYVEDATFARFRAAIYWLSRREDAAGEVPENMSVAVETWMEETASDLEQRYNAGETFRMPPAPRRRRAVR